MYIKLLGASLILAGCGGCGFRIAMLHRREVLALHQLVQVTDGMCRELEYRLTPLPELCRHSGEYATGPVGRFFLALAQMLDSQADPLVSRCISLTLEEIRGLPVQTAEELLQLGQTLGQYDLQGQLNALQQCKQGCLQRLEKLEHQQAQRLRSYQTLGFCAGAALAILLF